MAALGSLVFVAALATLAACSETSAPGAVHVLSADTDVNGVLARYLDRGLDRAERDGAAAVVIRIDTPGGRIDSMRDIVSRIEASGVPTITWVGPPGAQAASAGTFIAMAGDVAAMAPNTTIGAATPVDFGGGDLEGDIGRKVENDTVAFARGIAELRDRNPTWAELAVREAASATPNEALELGVVDLVVPSLQTLLTEIDGREVTLLSSGESSALDVASAELVFNDRNLYERTLGKISNPVVVSVLLLIGLGGLAMEFFNPGLFVPALVGITATIASFLGIGTLLPVEAAVLFLGLGITLFVAELFLPTGGMLGSGGAVMVVLGLSILVGQGTTDMNLRGLVTAVLVVALTVALMAGAAFVVIARKYLSSSEPSQGQRIV